MSYILDALRKADAERDRGNVPGIHAQPSFGGAMPTGAQPAAKPWLWLAAGAFAVLLIGALAWFLMGAPRNALDAAAATAAPIAPVPIAPATAPATVVPAAPVTVPAPPARAVATKPEVATVTPRPRPSAAPPGPAPAPAAVGDKPVAVGEKIYSVAELPDDIRRQLPNVSVGGSMYSPRPADRILIVNGLVLHEGDRIAPELVLQQIRVKGAVLSFKGYRYAIAF